MKNHSPRLIEQLNQKLNSMSPNQRLQVKKLVRAYQVQDARENLASFVRQAWPVIEPGPLHWNWHIEHICAHLQAVTDGRIKRLLINIPPGHMKSLIVSVFWPAWMWLHQPEWRMLCGSYAQVLALRDSDRCRDLILSDWYQNSFRPNWTLDKKQNAKSHFRNTATGSRVAFSVGGRVTGLRGNCVLVDDPLNAMDAHSNVKRQRANQWLDEAVTTRLNDPRTGAIVIIMQRLHHEDTSGHVLEQTGYEHLCLPSRFDPERAYQTSIGWSDPRKESGELLFQEMYTSEALAEAECRLGLLAFAGQHQQIPTPASGNLFKAHMLCPTRSGKTFWPYPTGRIQEAHFSWDTATKTKTYNDFTAGCVSMLADDGYVYLMSVTLDRLEVPDVVRAVAVQWASWSQRLGPSLCTCRIEEGAGTAVVQFVRRLLQQRGQAAPPTPVGHRRSGIWCVRRQRFHSTPIRPSRTRWHERMLCCRLYPPRGCAWWTRHCLSSGWSSCSVFRWRPTMTRWTPPWLLLSYGHRGCY
jgi:hypothetical protein